MHHLKKMRKKILSYQEDHLYIPRGVKVQVLRPVEHLQGLVTNLRNDRYELLSRTYH